MKTPIVQDEWLKELAANAERVRGGEVGESVHQMRVSAGRLDVWLRMSGHGTLRDDLLWVRRSAAHVRDLDVLLGHEVPQVFRTWARGEHEHVRLSLVEVLEDSRTQALIEALRLLPPVERKCARSYLADEQRKLERRRERALRESATYEDWHALRRSLRRLRYAREWLAWKSGPLKTLQDALGALNDGVKALDLLDRSPHAGELAEWRAKIAAQVERRLARARTAWRKAKLPPPRNSH